MKGRKEYFKQYLERHRRHAIELRRKELFASLFSSEETDVILDAGCGVGAYSYHLWRNRRNVISADVSVEALKVAKEHYRFPNLICCDILKLPFRDNSFSKIILIEVVEHIKEQSALFSELGRALKAEGLLLVTTSPIKSHILFPLIEKASQYKALHRIFHFYASGEHVAIQDPEKLRENLRKHRFEISSEKYWNTFHSFHFLTLINIHVLPFAYAQRLHRLLTSFDDFLSNTCISNDMIVLARNLK